jgi:hypothetical protein
LQVKKSLADPLMYRVFLLSYLSLLLLVFSISCRLNHTLTSMMLRILSLRLTYRVSTLSYSETNVAVDPALLELISGSTVDLTTGLIGSQFKINVKNQSRLTE